MMNTAKKLRKYDKSSIPVRFLNAAVDHLDEDTWVFGELNHELLILLHLAEGVLVHSVCVVEKEVVFRGQLNSHILDVVVLVTL